MKTIMFGALLLAASTCGPAIAADPPKITHDWPAFYGPDGTYADLTKVPILADLSQAELVWTSEHADLGYGKTSSGGGTPPYSHPSGSVDLIITQGLVIQGYFNPKNNIVADDILLALDTATGKTKWKQIYTDEGYNRRAGKHVQYAPTPVAYDGKVFFLGSGGRLHCVEVATGKRVWDRDIEDFPARFKVAVAKVKVDTAEGVIGVLRPVGLTCAFQSPLAVVGGVLFVSDSPCYGFDPATGKDLWKAKMAGQVAGQLPSPVKINGIEYALYTSPGTVCLLDPKTGKVLWTEKREGAGSGLGIPSDLVADGRLFIAHPNADKKKVLSAFAISETGLKLQWQTKEVFADPGYFACRDGVVYYNDCGTKSIRTYKADDGTLLCNFDTKGANTYWGQFHLWGDRMVLIGDHCHESIWAQCAYSSLTPGYKDLKASGGIFYPRALLPTSEGKYIGVCGYAELWSRPVFVDGYLFTRGVNKQESLGAIFCWDLRALPEDQRVTAAKETFAKGQKTEAVKALIDVLNLDARRVRADACRALAKMDQIAAPAGPDLVHLLPEWWQPDAKAAFAALIALGTGTEKAVFAAIDNPSADVRRQAWQILTTVTPKSAETVAAARKAAVKEADGKSQQAAFECLVSHGEAAVPTLVAMIESPEEQRVGLAALGMLGERGKSVLPKVLPLLEHADANLCRYAVVVATKLVPEERLPDTAEKWLKEMMLNPGSFPRDARCDYTLGVRHLQRFGTKVIPTFVETCTTATEKRDWQRMLRGAYGLSLYGAAAKDQLPVLENCLKKFSNHKDYAGNIKPPLEKAIAMIKDDRK